VTTLREALEAVASGDPLAMRKAVEAMGEALTLLLESDSTKVQDGARSGRQGR
jgi:hypothetical protein